MLGRLFDVQTRDLELDAFDTERAQTPAALLEARAKRTGLERRLEDKHHAQQQLAKEVRDNEAELSSLQARRRAASEHALMATSAKEASQYQNQELQFATRLEELEADTLPLMERLEVVEGEVRALEGELAELQPVLDELDAQETARLEALEARAAGIRTERAALAQGLDAALLKQYEQVRRARRGVGLAQLMDGERCGGCNVRIPIHVLQKVKRGTEVIRCPSCGRILWLSES